jgi:hypothetical protein
LARAAAERIAANSQLDGALSRCWSGRKLSNLADQRFLRLRDGVERRIGSQLNDAATAKLSEVQHQHSDLPKQSRSLFSGFQREDAYFKAEGSAREAKVDFAK